MGGLDLGLNWHKHAAIIATVGVDPLHVLACTREQAWFLPHHHPRVGSPSSASHALLRNLLGNRLRLPTFLHHNRWTSKVEYVDWEVLADRWDKFSGWIDYQILTCWHLNSWVGFSARSDGVDCRPKLIIQWIVFLISLYALYELVEQKEREDIGMRSSSHHRFFFTLIKFKVKKSKENFRGFPIRKYIIDVSRLHFYVLHEYKKQTI